LKKRPRLSKEQAMAAFPLRNEGLQAAVADNGELSVTIPRRKDWLGKVLSIVFVVPKQRHVVLDAVGADVWGMCDGQHTVSDVIGGIAEKYRLNRKEAEVSVTTYMRQLGKRGLLAFAVAKKQGE